MHEKIQACELRTYFKVFKVGGNGGFVIVCRVVAVIWFLRQRKAEERKKILLRGVTEGQKEVEVRDGAFSYPPPPLPSTLTLYQTWSFGMNKRELLSLIHQNKTPALQGNFVTGIFLIN